MDLSTIPAGGLSLSRTPEEDGLKIKLNSAILLRLNNNFLQDVKAAVKGQGKVQLVTGNRPVRTCKCKEWA